MAEQMIIPAYVISDTGYSCVVSYQDDWCYGKSRPLGRASSHEHARKLIKVDIRQGYDERNGLPVYHISDHGNLQRIRCVRLRRR
jgi:hypothetical protein